MKINIIKPHTHYSAGEHEVDDARGLYLIKMGVAEEVKEKAEKQPAKEKKEITPKKEKREK